jgi:glycosyltransferase involved in cell wall biosynthesis
VLPRAERCFLFLLSFASRDFYSRNGRCMRILIALPGLHRANRGAEFAFIALAKGLAGLGDQVTLMGSGIPEEEAPYGFLHAASVRREHFERYPSLPILRNEYCYEELTFAPSCLWKYRPDDYDLTVTCSYPFTNWILRRPVWRGRRPRHVFVTHNGDWPPVVAGSTGRKSEYRFFGCDGLVCINPDFFERNRDHWNCRLIPNGVDCDRFQSGVSRRKEFGLPEDRLIVLMVSALIPNKRIEIGIEAVSRIPDAHLVVAGDGPLRAPITETAARLLPGRFTLLTAPPERMPALYQSSDVFLQCSKDEPFPLVFLEAMACGLPIVGHDSPRVRWFVGDAEYLVDMDDHAAIAEAITCARASDAVALQQRISRSKKFSWPRIVEKYRGFFQEITAE